MSTEYTVLDNRPIDQWKVTELKDELRRRRLPVKGLKDDLIRRLDEALRDEMDTYGGQVAMGSGKDKEANYGEEAGTKEDAVQVQVTNGFDGNLEPQAILTDVEARSTKNEMLEGVVQEVNKIAAKVDANGSPDYMTARSIKKETVEDIGVDGENKAKDVNENASEVDVNGSPDDMKAKSSKTVTVQDVGIGDGNQILEVDEDANNMEFVASPNNLFLVKVHGEESAVTSESLGLVGQEVGLAVSVETKTTTEDTVIVHISSSRQDSQNIEIKVDNEDPKLSQEDAVHNMSNPDNQVSEVSPILGFPVNSETISTDSVSINEKNELKDNLNADNAILELEVFKPEMVQPSSSDVPYESGDVHPMDEQVPHENQSSIEEVYDTNATHVVPSQKFCSAEGGFLEKLNLDRSSGDDSIEEDILESKPVDSNHNHVGVTNEVPDLKEGSSVDATDVGLSFSKSENPDNSVSVPAEKRKLKDQDVALNNEPVKRQRKWNTETVKVPEPQTCNTNSSITPKETIRSIPYRNVLRSDPILTPRRKLTRSDLTLSGGDTPKERVVPPSSRPPTNSLRINNFLRPFTLKAVQELLAKTGTVSSFWMDHIKTHCYVTYSSVEEAIATRNALYNLQWPVNGGKFLAAEFVDPEEVKLAEASPQPPVAPISNTQVMPSAPLPFSPRQQDLKPSTRQEDLKSSPRQQDVKPFTRQQDLRQQLPPPPALPPPPPLSELPPVRERLQLPPPPPMAKKPDPPIVTLDDLFKKTKATPRIYYLPLSEEQVAAKLSSEGKNSK